MESNLKQYIEELISEIQNELDEATATGNVAGYNTPNAFSDKGSSDKNRKKKMAKRIGYTLAGKIDESFMSDLDIIKKGSKDITDFIKKVLSNKDYKEVRTDKEFHKYLKSFYNESVVTEGKDEVTPKQLANLQRDIKKINPKIKVYISNHPITKGKLQIELGSDHPSNQGDDREITKINALLKKHTGDWRTGTMFTEGINEGPMDRIFGGIPYTKKGKQSIVTMKLPDDVKERIIQRAKKEGKVAKPNFGGGVTVFESVNEAKSITLITYGGKKTKYNNSDINGFISNLNLSSEDLPGMIYKASMGNPSIIGTNAKSYNKKKEAILKLFQKIKSHNGNVVIDVDSKNPSYKHTIKFESSEYKVGDTINEAKIKRPVNRWLELKNDETMHPHKKMAHGLKELKYQLAETEKFFKWYNKIKNINELESSNYWKRTQNHIYKIKERLVNIARTIQEIEK